RVKAGVSKNSIPGHPTPLAYTQYYTLLAYSRARSISQGAPRVGFTRGCFDFDFLRRVPHPCAFGFARVGLSSVHLLTTHHSLPTFFSHFSTHFHSLSKPSQSRQRLCSAHLRYLHPGPHRDDVVACGDSTSFVQPLT